MPKNAEYVLDSEIADIMESLTDSFPEVFEGFRVDMIHTIKSLKKSAKQVIKIARFGYPREVFAGGKPYIVEVFLPWWGDMSQKQKNLAVFHVMCAIPAGGFDEMSSNYGKMRQYDYRMFKEEFAVTGGVPDWWENDAARDPMDVAKENEEEDEVVRVPMTKEDIEGAVEEEVVEDEIEDEEEDVVKEEVDKEEGDEEEADDADEEDEEDEEDDEIEGELDLENDEWQEFEDQ